MQAAHAAIEHAYLYGRPADHHPSYIHLTAKNQHQLMQLRARLHEHGIRTAEFHEPYQDWGLTAISCCIPEEQRHLLRGFQLWRLPTQDTASAHQVTTGDTEPARTQGSTPFEPAHTAALSAI